jgi:hypothetical protein
MVALGDDIRVLIIKLADRLHNLRTLSALPPDKQKKIAKESLDIFAPLADRLSLGASLRGEMVMPGYSIFANLGWNLIHGNKKDQRLYQVIGIKLYLQDNFFGTFGIRATHFTKAQYLYWSLGYTINGRSYQK